MTFTINLPSGSITDTLVTALTNDIATTIANKYNVSMESIRPFVQVTIYRPTPAISNRRLLQFPASVTFTLLGNVSSVIGNSSVEPVNASSIASIVTTAIATGTLVDTASDSLGLSVPAQTVEIEDVVMSVEPSSTGGSFDSSTVSETLPADDDSSNSSPSDHAVANAVISSLLVVIVLLAVG